MTIHENQTTVVLVIELGVAVMKAWMRCSDKALNIENTNKNDDNNNNNNKKKNKSNDYEDEVVKKKEDEV
jgi:hypothetical protein